jgi:signal transduction histidine kinase
MSGVAGSAFGQGPQSVRATPIDDLPEIARMAREENPRWRLVFPVTSATREFILDQMPALFTAYGVAMSLILLVVIIEGARPLPVIAIWLAEGLASIAARALILRRMARSSPLQVASSTRLRLLPLFAIVLAAIHWGWTATLFIGPQLSPTTVVMLLTYVMLSIACLGLAPASPLICAAYLVPMWTAVAWMLAASDWASGSTLLALLACLAGVLWCGYYFVVSGVRRNLLRGDEADLLMRELRERNAEVELLRATAAADLETRSTVFSSASHDLRQRIHALKLLAHTNANNAPFKSPLRRIATTIEELEGFVTDVLQFVRFDSSSNTNRLSEVPLQQVLQAMEVQFEALAQKRDARLRIRATPLSIKTDAVILGRVLENLVSNALKFTRKDVLVVARKRGDYVCLEVWDQGPGLDTQRLQSGPVARTKPSSGTSRTTSTTSAAHHEGFGLGLMIVRRLVDALGYRVEFHSKPQRGTLVRIVIPTRHTPSEGQP